jgi:hypothetical protein
MTLTDLGCIPRKYKRKDMSFRKVIPFDNGRKTAMSKEADYTAQEWKTISAAPVMAGLLVSMSDMSGPVGLAKEAIAVAKGVAETAAVSSNELIKAVADGIRARGGKPEMPDLPNDLGGARLAMIDGCKQAASLVTQKSPAEAGEYKAWLALLARKTAEASKEGGFLGIGGRQVSEGENSAIKELATALGIAA